MRGCPVESKKGDASEGQLIRASAKDMVPARVNIRDPASWAPCIECAGPETQGNIPGPAARITSELAPAVGVRVAVSTMELACYQNWSDAVLCRSLACDFGLRGSGLNSTSKGSSFTTT